MTIYDYENLDAGLEPILESTNINTSEFQKFSERIEELEEMAANLARESLLGRFDTIVVDDYGVERYKGNKIVIMLLELCDSLDLNKIAALTPRIFSEKERKEFYKMIGYSLEYIEEIFSEEDDDDT